MSDTNKSSPNDVKPISSFSADLTSNQSATSIATNNSASENVKALSANTSQVLTVSDMLLKSEFGKNYKWLNRSSNLLTAAPYVAETGIHIWNGNTPAAIKSATKGIAAVVVGHVVASGVTLLCTALGPPWGPVIGIILYPLVSNVVSDITQKGIDALFEADYGRLQDHLASPPPDGPIMKYKNTHGTNSHWEAPKKGQKLVPYEKWINSRKQFFNAENIRKRDAAIGRAFVGEHSPKSFLEEPDERESIAHTIISLEKARAARPAPLKEKIASLRKSLPLASKYAKHQKTHRSIQKLSEPYYRSLPLNKKAQFLANTMTSDELQTEADRLIIELEFAEKVKSGQIKPQPTVSKATKANIIKSNKVDYKSQTGAPGNPASSAAATTTTAGTPVAADPAATTPAAKLPVSVGSTGGADTPPANIVDSHAKDYESPTPTEDVPAIDPPGSAPASATSAPGSSNSGDSLPNYDSASPDMQEVSSSTTDTGSDVTINQTYKLEQKDPPIPEAHVVAQAEVQSSYQSGQGERSVTLGSCGA